MQPRHRGAMGAFLEGMETDIESPEYRERLNQGIINRPLKSWDFPLQDAGWRRWFDTLKAKGVTKLGDASVGRKRGMFPGSIAALDQPVLTGQVDPSWTHTQGTGDYYEPHEQFMKRHGRR